MLGLIITGHGNFGTGLYSSLKLIAGEQKNVYAIDFPQEISIVELESKLKSAMEAMSELDGVLVLSDLAGGSPMKTAAMLSLEHKNVAVVAGTNLPMIIEAALTKDFQECPFEFGRHLVNTAKESTLMYENKPKKVQESSEDGI